MGHPKINQSKETHRVQPSLPAQRTALKARLCSHRNGLQARATCASRTKPHQSCDGQHCKDHRLGAPLASEVLAHSVALAQVLLKKCVARDARNLQREALMPSNAAFVRQRQRCLLPQKGICGRYLVCSSFPAKCNSDRGSMAH